MAKIGFAYESITPKKSMLLGGYDCTRWSTTIHDLLYCRVIVIESDTEFICFTQFDVLCVGKRFVDLIKNKALTKGIALQNTLVGAIHTHSAPNGLCHIDGMDGIFGEWDETYMQYCLEVFESCLEEALAQRNHFTAQISYQIITDICSQRHNPDLDYDHKLWKIEFNRNDGKRILLYNYACHPTVLHADNLAFSADIIGATNHALMSDTYDMVLFYNGSAGDISTRFTRKGADFSEVERLGNYLAYQIQNNQEYIVYQGEINNICIYQKHIRLNTKSQRFINDFKKHVDELKKADALAEQYKEASINLQFVKDIKYPDYVEINFDIIELENCFMVTIPSEITSSLTMSLTSQYHCMILSYVNGYHMYLPSKETFDKKYYESAVCLIDQGEGEKLIKYIKKCLIEIMEDR